jgi:hypothetical protein
MNSLHQMDQFTQIITMFGRLNRRQQYFSFFTIKILLSLSPLLNQKLRNKKKNCNKIKLKKY